MTDKVIGYVLLAIGLVVIFFSANSVLRVLTRQAQPANLFNFDSVGLDTSAFMPKELAQAGFAPQQQQAELLPANILNDTSNIFAHLIFMGFFVTVGFRVSMIGVNLLRPYRIKAISENKQAASTK